MFLSWFEWEPYDSRKVENTTGDGWMVDTAKVCDRSWTYETGVKHKDFRLGEWVIVAGCNTKEEAVKNHYEWVKKLREGVDELHDIWEDITYEKDYDDEEGGDD